MIEDVPTFVVEIADSTGLSDVEMTQAELVEKVNATQLWVFVNDQLVSAADIAGMNLEAGSRIRLMTGLVGPPRIHIDGETHYLGDEELRVRIEVPYRSYRLLINGKLATIGKLFDSTTNSADRKELRSDLLDVHVSPARTLLLRRAEYEQIVRQSETPVLASIGAKILRNGDIKTLISCPDEVFEKLWSNGPLDPVFLLATSC